MTKEGHVDTQLWKRGASELAAMVASGEVSALEVVEGHLRRIEAVNPGVNAITNVLAAAIDTRLGSFAPIEPRPQASVAGERQPNAADDR
jgi:amidase